jgi:hypothetical protein
MACGLASDEEDEEDNTQTKVFFNKKRTGNGHVTVGTKRPSRGKDLQMETVDLFSDSSD